MVQHIISVNSQKQMVLNFKYIFSTTSLRRHAATFHETEWQEILDNEGVKQPTTSKSKRSSLNGRALIFELFDKINEKESKCKICSEVITEMKRGSTTNIRHHALSFHESEWTVIRENANSHRRSVKSRSVSWGRAIVYKLFKKQGDLAKCRICSKILSALDGNTTTMRRHAIRFHELEWNDIQVS